MSTYGVSSSVPLSDLDDDPEILFHNFLIANWNDMIAGIAAADINFGYEPDQNSTKPLLVKVEENFTDHTEINLGGSYDQNDIIMDVHIWERDSSWYTTKPGTNRFKIRKYIERFIMQHRQNGDNNKLKHFMLMGSQNVREPERTDWHHSIVTFRIQLWKVSTI